MDWQSSEVSKPFDPLLLDVMMDALCSYRFSDLGVADHVSSGLLDSFSLAYHFAGLILRSRGLVMVQVWHWYVSVCRKMEFMILLFVSIEISEYFSIGASVDDIAGLLYPVFNFPVHSTVFCEYAAKIFELFDLFEICVIDLYVEGAWCPTDLHCLCLVDTDLHVVLLAYGA